MRYDFSGWATRNNIRCSDGRTIRQNAFIDNDGQTVPLVWNHQHNGVDNVLGHALLENREDGVYAYCTLNDTPAGQDARTVINHGDVVSLSIYANRLKQRGADVIHGAIREVSLVLAGANPGAYIDSVIRHGEESNEEAIIYSGEDISLYHADDWDEEEEDEDMGENEETVEDVINSMTEKQRTVMYALIGQVLEGVDDDSMQHSDDYDYDDETISDIFDTLTDKQKNVVYGMIGQVANDGGVDASAYDDGGDDYDYDDDDDYDYDDDGGDYDSDDGDMGHSEGGFYMKRNIFENDDYYEDNVLCHSDQEAILDIAKKTGSFQEALNYYVEENELQHDGVSGFAQESLNGTLTVDALFPQYKDVRPGAPELVTSDQGWISVVMNNVHKSPISRIRTGQVDIRNIDDLRAKGYDKGKRKTISGNFNLVRRTTDPQTVYVKSALHKDDIIDITDFDYVQYLYKIDRMMLNEELATAIMLGDGRDETDENKISPEHIRPIWLDDELYTIHVAVDQTALTAELQGTDTSTYFGQNFIQAESLVNTILYSRENFKGSGTPDMFITPHKLNLMLLARDRNGRRIYSGRDELASALNVGRIYTAEQFAGKTRAVDGKTMKLEALIVNLADYSLGATKGGEVSHFTQFDIDFNQQKSLLETRCSGALTRIKSAIAIEEEVVAQG